MGGEPTFVSARDRDGAEWNTDALGPTKRGLPPAGAQAARTLWRGRLPALRPGQVVSGRAAAALGAVDLLARRRRAVLARPSLFADERAPDHYTSADAQRFMDAGAPAGRRPGCIQPGYEDVWYYLWRERKLPVNVDPLEARLDDELERARLRRVFDAGLASVTGYVLPLARGDACGLDHRPLVPARRAHVPAARRFANGLPAAARFAAVGLEGRLSVAVRPGPVRAARAAAGGGAAARAVPAANWHDRWSRFGRGAGRHPPWRAPAPRNSPATAPARGNRTRTRSAPRCAWRSAIRAARPGLRSN
jgi:hypothetical protein